MKKWYLGAQNDGLFIIDQPPRSSNDNQMHDADVNCILPVPNSAMDFAEAVIKAHNEAIGF